jgi:hypothetical protein
MSAEAPVDLDSLAKLGEFVGGFFVVISLVYLAHQVRQNTKSLRTENYARVLDRMSTVQSRLSVDPDLNRILTTGAENPGKLTRSERLRFSWALYELFGAVEFMYLQSRENALPPAVWARWEASLIWWLSHPGMRAWWATKPAPLVADFERFGDNILRNRQMDPGTLERWRGFVAGEGLPGAAPQETLAPRQG